MSQMQEQNVQEPIITPVYCKQKRYLIEDVSQSETLASEDSNSSEYIHTGQSHTDDDSNMSSEDILSKDKIIHVKRKKIIVSTTPPTVSEVIVNRTKTPLAEGTIIYAHEELTK
jgi:hypothetical protein